MTNIFKHDPFRPVLSMLLGEAFSLCVFAFNCHLNVVPIADQLNRPTSDRLRKISARVNIFQWLFYSLIGVTGHFRVNMKHASLTG